MTRFKTVPYAAGLAAALVLSGCQGGSPDQTPSSTSTPQATTSATSPATTPATASPSTSGGPTFPPGLPAAAKAHTKPGAEAFIHHFVTQVNSAWRRAEPDRLRSLCLATSKSCQGYASQAAELSSKGHHYKGDAVSISRLIPLGQVDGASRFQVVIDILGAQVVDEAGRTIRTDTPESVKNYFFVWWGPNGWTIKEIAT